MKYLNKIKSREVAVIGILAIAVLIIGFEGARLLSDKQALRTSEQQIAKLSNYENPGPTLGKPCSYNQVAEILDTNGLQCYFSGSSDARTGIWIHPDIRHIGFQVPKAEFAQGFKKLTAINKSYTFQYPPQLVIGQSNDSFNTWISYADLPLVNIEQVDRNAVSAKERIDQVIQGYTHEHYADQIGGKDVEVYVIAPPSNLDETRVYITRDYGVGYYWVQMNLPGDPYYDYLAWATVATVNFAN